MFAPTEDLLDEVQSEGLDEMPSEFASKRTRKQPARFVVDERGLRQRGSGERYQPKDVACRCKRKECEALFDERQWLQSVLSSVKEIREQMLQLAHAEAAAGDAAREPDGVAALQQAMLVVLDLR